jgi:uncharacterized membrane protein
METTRTGQEKLAAALSALVFFVPLLMNVKTSYVVKYMKQGFIINVAELALAIISSLLWGVMGIAGLLNFVCVLTSFWLAFQAFTGKEYVISILMENAEKLITTLGIQSWFTSK